MKFKIEWTKTYRRSGNAIIEADTKEEAELEAYSQLGDFEGSLQYYPDESEIMFIKELE